MGRVHLTPRGGPIPDSVMTRSLINNAARPLVKGALYIHRQGSEFSEFTLAAPTYAPDTNPG